MDGSRASGILALLERFELLQLLGVAFVVEMDRVVAGEAGVKFGRSLSRCRVSHSLNDSIQLSLDFCI